MIKLKVRCFLFVFYCILWLLFGRDVFLMVLLSHIVVIPMLFVFSSKFRNKFVFITFAWPFVRHEDPKKLGLDGARNIQIKYECNVDKCKISLGVWHALPKSLVQKHRFLLNSADKDKLNNLFDEELRNSEYPVILYFHGIIGTRASDYRIQTYNVLQNLDAHVVTFDYRGFGDSTNKPTQKITAIEDGLIVYSWIRRLVGNDKPVYIWGHSIGGGLVLRVFSKLASYSNSLLGLKEQLPPPQGIVVESGYNSNVDLAKGYILALPLTALPIIENIISHALSRSDTRLIAENYAESLRQYPILLLHSTDDTVVPYQYGKKLYEKLQEARKEGDSPVVFKTFERGHIDIIKDPTLPGIVEDFIKQKMKTAQS